MDDLAREYYRAIDEHDYQALSDILGSDFTHDRPDQTIEGREAFVQFMRDERPETDTAHEVAETFRNENGIAVRGRLNRADGSEWFEFVDVFAVVDGALKSLKTYTRND
jgi:ketosteroid isomerase-like protein